MITFMIFQISFIVFIIFLVLNYILGIFFRIPKITESKFLKFLNIIIPSKIRIAIQFIALFVFLMSGFFGNIVPYFAQEKDLALIDEYSANIKLYEQYSDEYAVAARTQIEQYQKMQSEMARTATVAQLQFWSQQQDAIGNQLTDSIKKFQDLIMQQKLDINSAQARINRRPYNKWYFGI